MEEAYAVIDLQRSLWTRMVHSLSLMTRPSLSFGELRNVAILLAKVLMNVGVAVEFVLSGFGFFSLLKLELHWLKSRPNKCLCCVILII